MSTEAVLVSSFFALKILSLVWNNLISNAFKFTNDGGRVAISLEADGKYAVVKISDSGAVAALAYPVYNFLLKSRRKKIAPEILRLSEELMK